MTKKKKTEFLNIVEFEENKNSITLPAHIHAHAGNDD